MAQLQVGDLVFLAIDNPLYRRVAAVSQSWTSHVGVVVAAEPGKELVAESTFPVSKKTAYPDFIARSKAGQYSVKRLTRTLTESEKQNIQKEADLRMGIFYHIGFKFDSKMQFCSKFAYEIYRQATGLEIGTLETFKTLLSKNETTPLMFWYLWYTGFIPWKRKTVTPASLYNSELFETVEEYIL